MNKSAHPRRLLIVCGVTAFLIYFVIQFALTARANTITWDEEDHIYAGYEMWKHGDFGLNPEHPPLLKLLATAPLLSMPLKEPPLQDRGYRVQAMLGGTGFIFHNDADKIVFRTRMAASLVTLLLVVLVFLTAQEMFSTAAGFLALGLIAFDPTLLAHGPLVTTDAAQACFMLASIFAFYRYVKLPSTPRLIVTGLAVGLALASKHSALLLFPMLIVLALIEALRPSSTVSSQPSRERRALHLTIALLVIVLISVVVLWASYGFRYAARGKGLALNPPIGAQILRVHSPLERDVLSAFAHLHLLPQSYLYGLAHVLFSANAFNSFVLGRAYPHAVWFFFPVAIAIKSTLTFLILAAITLWAISTKRIRKGREMLFLLVPAALYLAIAMVGGENIGIRHVLPVYIFVSVAIGGAAAALIQQNRRWLYAVVALLIFQAISVARTWPAYIAYANEAAGGPSRVHNYLSDSSVDWAQQLRPVKRYLDQRGVKDCWFLYFGHGLIDYTYYGIPCKPLPTIESLWLGAMTDVPPSIDGPVLISATDLSGFEYGPGPLNPYSQFKSLKPTKVIDYSVFVYDGHFDVPLASAFSHTQKAGALLTQHNAPAALSEAQQAVALAPDSVRTNVTMGTVLDALNRREEARAYYQKALTLAETVEPQFQRSSIAPLKLRLAQK
jgi:4-amino-4-deoxy-L-arabinose transferase-like glycosyltransferase